MTDLVCLTLVAARNLQDELFDALASQAHLAPGFTASEATGHGSDVALQSTAERVKGHADQVLIRVILKDGDVDLLTGWLEREFRGSGIKYWLSPVTRFGTI